MSIGYNPIMPQRWNFPVIGRLLVVAGLILLLGITPRPHTISRQFQQVSQALERGLPGKAAALTAEIARNVPWRGDLWERAGSYAWQAGDLTAAIDYLEQAAQYGEISSENQLHLADALLNTGSIDDAERLLLDTLKVNPSNQTYIRLFQVHRFQKNFTGALADIQAISQLEPENPNLSYMEGVLQMVLNPKEALTPLENAASLNETFEPTISTIENSLLLAHRADDPAEALLIHGQILAALQEWELAGEAFHRATLIQPDNASAWAYLGEATQHDNGVASFYVNLYRLEYTPPQTPEEQTTDDESYADLQTALDLDPKLVTGHVFMSLYWSRQHRYDLALDGIEKAIALQPDEPTFYSQKGSIQAMLGDLSGALLSYQEAVKVSENDPQTLELLISFCIAFEYQVKEVALPAARTLLQADGQDAATLDLAGQVFYLLENPAGKIYLEKAIAQDANYAPAHLHLGLFYLQQGDLNRAKEEFALAQSLAAGTTTGDQAQRLLNTYFP